VKVQGHKIRTSGGEPEGDVAQDVIDEDVDGGADGVDQAADDVLEGADFSENVDRGDDTSGLGGLEEIYPGWGWVVEQGRVRTGVVRDVVVNR